MKHLLQMQDDRRLDFLKMDHGGRSSLVRAVTLHHLAHLPACVSFCDVGLLNTATMPWFTADHSDCVGELKRDSVGGKAPERQVCVGDHTKGRGEQWRCQVLANLQCRQQFVHQYSTSPVCQFPAAGGRDRTTADRSHGGTAASIKAEVNQLRGTYEQKSLTYSCYDATLVTLRKSICMCVYISSREKESDPGVCLHASTARAAGETVHLSTASNWGSSE